jgi:hypothetical protein
MRHLLSAKGFCASGGVGILARRACAQGIDAPAVQAGKLFLQLRDSAGLVPKQPNCGRITKHAPASP